jgi:hypothetical protein
MNNTKFRLTATTFIGVIILVFGIYLLAHKPPVKTTNPASSTSQSPAFSYQGVEGQNALDLLKASHKVQTQTSSYGEFVQSIDSVTPDSQHFWAFYVNDKISDVGAGSYVTKASDAITWKLDAIQ